jgi:hypothetical protein
MDPIVDLKCRRKTNNTVVLPNSKKQNSHHINLNHKKETYKPLKAHLKKVKDIFKLSVMSHLIDVEPPCLREAT